jgi:pantoate kinase
MSEGQEYLPPGAKNFKVLGEEVRQGNSEPILADKAEVQRQNSPGNRMIDSLILNPLVPQIFRSALEKWRSNAIKASTEEGGIKSTQFRQAPKTERGGTMGGG